MSDELQQQIANLTSRVAALERQQWQGPPRLGPRPPATGDIEATTQRLVDAVKKTQHEHETDPQGRQICTTSGEAPSKVRASQTQKTGQHDGYIVLCEEERQKGFVRPYRDEYRHVGALQQLTDHAGNDSHQVRAGGCGTTTRMGRSLSETYARDPKFYSHTFCVRCNQHLPVAEFTWTADQQQVGS